MKIAYIAAGAGGMYCGSCIRDNALVRALKEKGHDALLLPLYTPIRTDVESVSEERIFYGAINIYLQQAAPWLARLPKPLKRMLDRPGLLRFVSKGAGSTDASQLGDLTLSMLRGEDGRQCSELEALARWLREELRPDVVHLSHSMFLGMARVLRESLPDTAIVCGLQGEDIFVDGLPADARERVLEEMRRRARDVDRFVATSRFYADAMIERYELEPERVFVAKIGIDEAGFDALRRPASPPPHVLGFVGRICPEKGFDRAVDAFCELTEELGPSNVRFLAAGYLGGRDQKFYDEQASKIRRRRLEESYEFLGEVSREQKLELLSRMHVFTMPAPYAEPKGLSVLEAMAAGVPVVQPAHGAFPELVEATGGGVLYDPATPHALRTTLAELLLDADRRCQLGETGKRSVLSRFRTSDMADEVLAAYAGFGAHAA